MRPSTLCGSPSPFSLSPDISVSLNSNPPRRATASISEDSFLSLAMVTAPAVASSTYVRNFRNHAASGNSAPNLSAVSLAAAMAMQPAGLSPKL
ncbi:MAG: hypothetical protein ACK55Z_07900, partial [bacterium]